jgi:hypothetical protein
MGKHDPDRDGGVHPDTAKDLNPKDFELSADADEDNGADDED